MEYKGKRFYDTEPDLDIIVGDTQINFTSSVGEVISDLTFNTTRPLFTWNGANSTTLKVDFGIGNLTDTSPNSSTKMRIFLSINGSAYSYGNGTSSYNNSSSCIDYITVNTNDTVEMKINSDNANYNHTLVSGYITVMSM